MPVFILIILIYRLLYLQYLRIANALSLNDRWTLNFFEKLRINNLFLKNCIDRVCSLLCPRFRTGNNDVNRNICESFCDKYCLLFPSLTQGYMSVLMKAQGIKRTLSMPDKINLHILLLSVSARQFSWIFEAFHCIIFLLNITFNRYSVTMPVSFSVKR